MKQTFYIETLPNGKKRKVVKKDVVDNSIEMLLESGFCERFVVGTLNHLSAKGNNSATDLLNGSNGVLTLEDLISDITIEIITLCRYGFFNGVQFALDDKKGVVELYRWDNIPTYKEYTDKRNYEKSGMYETPVMQYLAKVVFDKLTSFRTYGNKRVDLYTTYTDKNGNTSECSIFDIGKLANEYKSKHGIPSIYTLVDDSKVYRRTLDIIKAGKMGKTDIDVLTARIKGCNWKQTAIFTHKSIKTVRCARARLEKAYKQALEEFGKVAKTDNLPMYGNKGITTATVPAHNYETPYYTVEHAQKPLYDVNSALSVLEWCQHGYSEYMQGIVKKTPTTVSWWNDPDVTRKLNESDKLIKTFLHQHNR